MTDNNSSNKLPQMPKLTRLPSLTSSKPSSASMTDLPKVSQNPVIPALQSSATQLPNVANNVVDEGEATIALQAPTDEEISKAVSAFKSGSKASLPGLGIPLLSQPKKEAIKKDTSNEATVAMKAPPEKDIDNAIANIKSSGTNNSVPGFSSPFSLNKGLASIPSISLSKAPGLSPKSESKPDNIGLSSDFNSGLSSPSDPMSSPSKAKSAPSPVVYESHKDAPNKSTGASAQEDAPIFGGAALEQSELQYEDEVPDEENEKTMMLDAAPDEDLDISNEKTQISFGAMDFEPLSGKLIVESGKTNQREYLLVREKNSIGRAPSNDIAIADIAMSRKHVEIDKFPEGFRIRDLESGNGTILNDHRIRVAQLRNGDIIEIGSIRFKFEQEGGDPDVLWKGEPKIEYHPNQHSKRPRQQVSQQAYQNAQSSSQNPSQSSSQNPSYPPSHPSQQMESMLERQGGGIAAPSWTSAPPMTSPYMSYNGNMLRTVNSIPTGALVAFIAAIVLFVGSIVFLIVASVINSGNEKKVEAERALIADIQSNITKGVESYAKSQFPEALDYFKAAKNLDSNQTYIKDPQFFEKFDKLITEEMEITKDIKKINDKLDGIRNSASYSYEEFNKDLKLLQSVSDSSINKNGADQAISKITEAYVATLRKKIGDLIKEENVSEARKLIKELAKFPDTNNNATTFANRIATMQQRTNQK